MPIIAPALLQGKSTAIVSPMLPIFVHVDLHASTGAVGIVSSAYGVVQVCSSIFIGWLVAKIHYRIGACLALATLIGSCVLCYACSTVLELVLARSIGALAVVMWDLSRKVWMSVELPREARASVIATMSGLNKLATLLAVLASGFLAESLRTRSVFIVQASLTATALVVIVLHSALHSSGPTDGGQPTNSGGQQPANTLRAVFCAYWRVLATAGLFCASLNGCRIVWQLALPLKAHSVGLSKSTIGILSASFLALECCVNLSSTGTIMDRFGRKAAGVPALLLMACGFAVVSQAQEELALACGGVVYHVGNGLCGGIVATLAQDVTPGHARGEFLGLWKTVTTQGGLWMPAVFGAVSELSSLNTAVGAMAAVSALTAGLLATAVEESAPPHGRGTPAAPLLSAAGTE